MNFPSLVDRHVVLDTESTGLKWWAGAWPFSVAIWIGGEESSHYFDERQYPRMWEWLADELPRATMLINHHLKHDIHMLRIKGVQPPPVLWCTMTAEALLDEHKLEYNLGAIGVNRGLGGKQPMPELAVVPDDQIGMTLFSLPYERTGGYARRDAELTWLIHEQQVNELRAEELFNVMTMEMELLPVLARMEAHGVQVDLEAAHRAIPKLDFAIDTEQAAINMEAGKPLNINSTPQIRALFQPRQMNKYQWQLIDGTLTGPTKKGDNPTINQLVLREMKHPLASRIMRLRKLIKARDTFIRGHIIGHADERGYVHTTFNQTKTEDDNGVGPGRLSSTDPALQQINKRDPEFAVIIRSLFLPDEGHEWWCADHSQIDFRMSAHLINDPRIIAAYLRDPDMDYHQIVSDMTGIPRNPTYAGGPNTKQLNLSLAFGAGPGKIAFTMGMPYTMGEYMGRLQYQPGPEAEAVFQKYHAALPGVKQFMKYAEGIAKGRGYVKTIMGRRIRFPHGNGAHKAAGLLYQGYAADVHKSALIAIDRELAGQYPLLLSVHDEIGVSMPRDDSVAQRLLAWYTAASATSQLPASFKLRVPVTANAKFGENWYVASK